MADPHLITRAFFDSPVPPGTGWSDDSAIAVTPAACSAVDVARLAGASLNLSALGARIMVCRVHDRLVVWHEEATRTGRRVSFAHESHWGRPVASVGSEDVRIYAVGLTPAANGANHTGRMFIGDRSGDWLWVTSHQAGLAASSTSAAAGDRQRLTGARTGATVRCIPPANKPTTVERATCAPWLAREIALMPEVKVLLALGGIGRGIVLRVTREAGWILPRPQPCFGHEATAELTRPDGRAVTLLGNYHPSQQSTFTGRLTKTMLDDVLEAAKRLAET